MPTSDQGIARGRVATAFANCTTWRTGIGERCRTVAVRMVVGEYRKNAGPVFPLIIAVVDAPALRPPAVPWAAAAAPGPRHLRAAGGVWSTEALQEAAGRGRGRGWHRGRRATAYPGGGAGRAGATRGWDWWWASGRGVGGAAPHTGQRSGGCGTGTGARRERGRGRGGGRG